VEKYLKALLALLSIEFPKVHDIGRLARLLPNSMPLGMTVHEQGRLTDYATASRYPGEEEPFTRGEAEQALALARRARAAIRGHLPQDVLGN
jgi:HEPN domain-containing protein